MLWPCFNILCFNKIFLSNLSWCRKITLFLHKEPQVCSLLVTVTQYISHAFSSIEGIYISQKVTFKWNINSLLITGNFTTSLAFKTLPCATLSLSILFIIGQQEFSKWKLWERRLPESIFYIASSLSSPACLGFRSEKVNIFWTAGWLQDDNIKR